MGEAVGGNRVAQQFSDDRLVVVAEIGCHAPIMRRNRSQSQPSPLTLGQARAAQAWLIVWCKSCGHRVEPDIGAQMSCYGASVTVVDCAARLRLLCLRRDDGRFRRDRGKPMKERVVYAP